MNPTLSLADIVSVTANVEAGGATPNSYNQGLYVGPSTVIPATQRVRQYAYATYSTAMITDGFDNADPEYLAAQLYFGQSEPPATLLVGTQVATAISTIAVSTGGGGTGWAINDQFNIVQAGGSLGIGVVTAETAGVVTAVAVLPLNQGNGYSVATSLTTTAILPSTGTGLLVDITALGESLLQAVQACRAVSTNWYGFAVAGAVDADILALANYGNSTWQTTRYYWRGSNPNIPANLPNNLAAQISNLDYKVFGIYSTIQGGLYPNNAYADAACMGLEMGLNTGLPNSFFIAAHKTLVGVGFEPVTETQYSNLKTLNMNVAGQFNSTYNLLEPGVTSDGQPSFLWMYVAMWVNNIQINVANVLVTNIIIPQTNSGEQLLLNGADLANFFMAQIGFLAPGNWNGLPINIPTPSNPSVITGQTIPLGYLSLAPPYSQQSEADRKAGKAMPITIIGITAGGVRTVVIGVTVQL